MSKQSLHFLENVTWILREAIMEEKQLREAITEEKQLICRHCLVGGRGGAGLTNSVPFGVIVVCVWKLLTDYIWC